jgi:hypothetical protein
MALLANVPTAVMKKKQGFGVLAILAPSHLPIHPHPRVPWHPAMSAKSRVDVKVPHRLTGRVLNLELLGAILADKGYLLHAKKISYYL